MRPEGRPIDKPQCGLFRMRLVRGGLYVAARIAYGPQLDPETGEPMDRPYLWHGEINGQADPAPAPSPTPSVWHIWEWGEPITAAEYEYLSGVSSWAREHQPSAPEATPQKAIDHLTLKPLW